MAMATISVSIVLGTLICDRICEKGSSTHMQFSDFEGP